MLASSSAAATNPLPRRPRRTLLLPLMHTQPALVLHLAPPRRRPLRLTRPLHGMPPSHSKLKFGQARLRVGSVSSPRSRSTSPQLWSPLQFWSLSQFHDSLYPRLMSRSSVVHVLDPMDILSSCRYLYDILTKATVVKKRVHVLIFCNKTDKVTAHSKEFIRKQLEKEINKLRESRNALSSADISDEVKLGIPGEAFNFSQCQNKVTVAEGAGLTGNVSVIEEFIREYVKA
ncbi:hypothetical protein PR202_gn00773 [Eleusine coracana subsp. coracana]|uniref:Signal recognition particle receptor subunit beta n=1 Tax=Eleusine coracana subsp. coracana TaxID=191504 RepID=A0AAV5G6W4_ELECO|nr:hypothetical protein PR202_gn00773 [Eleusine coracana subsp. coracana]